MGFGALALVAPEAGEADGGAQLEKLCALALRSGECLMIADLRQDRDHWRALASAAIKSR
jgi:hypothetical protein